MKRNHNNDILYAVIETSDDNGIYVEFMPQLWLINSSTLKQRDVAQFNFPRRSQHQSKDSHMRFLKQAKFMCIKPENNAKWELRQGRVLRLDIGSLEDALSASKYYSDYFSTTEAENKIEEDAAPAPKKVMRKKKTNTSKAMDKSDSEDDNRGGTREVSTVSNYNIQYATDAQDLYTLDGFNNILPVDISALVNESLFCSPNKNSTEPSIQSTLTSQDGLADPSNEVLMTFNLPIAEDQSPEGSSEMNYQVPAISENNDLQNSSAPNHRCCKCHQKILNKIDYVQKKHSKELALVRQEASEIRKLLQQVLKVKGRQQSIEVSEVNGDEEDVIQGDPVHVDMAEIDAFNEKYKATFPINDSSFMIHFNKSLKLDQKFADSLFGKLDQIKGDDETKTARKILKELCDFRCLKDFTWLGTKKMKSFQDLHLILEMMTKLLTGKYPDCNAMGIITKVVQQRTKSAKEAWVEFLKKNEASSVAEEDGSGVDAENDSSITEKEAAVFAETSTTSGSSGADGVDLTSG